MYVSEFSRIVRAHDSDKGCKVNTMWCQFVWMLICHLGGCRSIKQLLRIKSFIGTTANAVLTQVRTSTCAILLLKYLAAKSKVKWNFSNLVHFPRVNLFVKIDLWYWLDYPFQKKKPPKRTAGLKQGGLFSTRKHAFFNG